MRENPFAGTPDPKYLYESSTHAEAKSSLIIGLECGVGFQALIAPPGMGKTTILFDVMEQFEPTARTAFLFQPRGDYREILRHLLSELGEPAGTDLLRLQQQINKLLLSERQAGKRTIVVVDEAQSLSSETLETLRLLSNFETPSEKLLQIVLAGQPQLGKNLADPSLRQLQQRISIVKTLSPLDLRETENYIQHRLWVGGYEGIPLFTSAAIKTLWETSYGIPREINTLCFNAMLLLAALKKKQVDEEILSEVIAEVPRVDHGNSVSPCAEAIEPAAKQVASPDNISGQRTSPENEQSQRLSAEQMRSFNFKLNPFDRVPDPSWLCLTSTHWGALAGLYTSIVKHGGTLMLVGAPGSGKSLVVSCVMKLLSANNFKVEYMAGEQCSLTSLLEIFPRRSEFAFHSGSSNASGIGPVLFIDEAERVPAESWQYIRAFIREKTPDRCPSIVIVGRSEIEDVVASVDLDILKRAIAMTYRLCDLSQAEIKNYIYCRLRLVQRDNDTAPFFADDAISAVAIHSRGNPGAINSMCEAALVKAYAEGHLQISADLIDQVAREMQPNVTHDERIPRHHPDRNAELVKAAGVLLDLYLALHA